MSTNKIADGFISITGIGASSTGTIAGNLTVSGAVNLPTATNLNGTSIATTLSSKANKDAPVFTGTVSLPSTTNLNGVSLVNTLSAKANIANPVFTGTANLPASSSVSIGGTSLATLLSTASGSASMSFGTATLVGTDTISVPFRNTGNTADLSIGTNYNPIITVDAVTETMPATSALYLFTGDGTGDSSGNSKTLTKTGGVIIGADVVKGGTIYFPDGNQSTTSTNNITFTTGTLSFDYKCTTVSNTYILRFGEDGLWGGTNTDGMWLNTSTVGGMYFAQFGTTFSLYFNHYGSYGNIGRLDFTGNSIVANTWNHIDLVFDSSGGIRTTNPKVYLNNVLLNSSVTGYLNNTTAFSFGFAGFKGVIFGNSIATSIPGPRGTQQNPTFANMRVTPSVLTSEQRAVLVANTPITPFATQVVARNTNNVQFKILNRAFGYMPIVANKAALKINATIVDGATVKASANIPVTQIT